MKVRQNIPAHNPAQNPGTNSLPSHTVKSDGRAEPDQLIFMYAGARSFTFDYIDSENADSEVASVTSTARTIRAPPAS